MNITQRINTLEKNYDDLCEGLKFLKIGGDEQIKENQIIIANV